MLCCVQINVLIFGDPLSICYKFVMEGPAQLDPFLMVIAHLA
jgi:hypothetical protein